MKKVIFICLLAIATCLSAPNDTPAAASTPPKDVIPHETKPAVTTAPATTSNATAPGNHPDASSVTPAGKTTTHPEDTNKPKPDEQKGKTDPAKDDKNKETSPKPSPTPAPAGPTTPPPPADHKSSTSTKATPTPEPAKPTAPTKPTDTPHKEGDNTLQARGFDGASFVGGIILTLGLLAIGFMGFKYYKNQTERNYHTL